MRNEALSPRYDTGFGEASNLLKRQGGVCASGSHSCLDIDSAACCPNDHYCFVNATFGASCCSIDSVCGSDCSESEYQCSVSTTISGVATATAACCSRTCPGTSAYLCAASYGGQCCDFDSSCVSGGMCATITSSTTSGVVVPSGSCTTSQTACATGLGGGCCDIGSSCLVLSNTNYCQATTGTNSALATRTGPAGIYATSPAPSSGASGLSTAAKAGIGAGVSIGACLALGGLIWFCVSYRRRKLRSQKSSSGRSPSGGGRPSHAAPMSQASGTVTSKNSKRPSNGRQGSSDYFGPAAQSGPYTDVTSPATSPGSRGVPATPQSPNDIQVPVEIDSRGASATATPGWEYMKGPGISEHPVELP